MVIPRSRELLTCKTWPLQTEVWVFNSILSNISSLVLLHDWRQTLCMSPHIILSQLSLRNDSQITSNEEARLNKGWKPAPSGRPGAWARATVMPRSLSGRRTACRCTSSIISLCIHKKEDGEAHRKARIVYGCNIDFYTAPRKRELRLKLQGCLPSCQQQELCRHGG